MLETLRFLFVGRFSGSPKGDRITVSGERMADVMARLELHAVVEVADRLGSAPSRRYDLKLSSARALRVADVWAEHEPLRSLAEVATSLVRPQAAIRLTEAIDRVRTLVGEGALVQALIALEPPPTAASVGSPAVVPPAPSSTSGGGSAIDAIFAQAELPQPDTVAAARSSIDAFVGAMRKPTPGGVVKPTGASQRASALILDAIEATAADALGHQPAAAIETSWRGLKFVLGESPGHAKLAIELLDTDTDHRIDALRRTLERAPVDAVFVTDAPDDLAVHAELAALGAAMHTPIIVALDAELLDAGNAPLSAWVELRGNPVTQWLCAAANEIVLACETTRVGPRVVFGPAVFAIAAMLGASLRRDGTFGDAFGRAGAVVGPASWTPQLGRGSGRNLPVRASMAVDAMRTMVDSGITVLGAEPGGERVLAVGAPMVAKLDGPGLAGRILVGRAARAARAAKDGLAHGDGPAELDAALLRAAAHVLPDGPPGTCTLRGRAEGSDLTVVADFRADAVGRAFSATCRV